MVLTHFAKKVSSTWFCKAEQGASKDFPKCADLQVPIWPWRKHAERIPGQ